MNGAVKNDPTVLREFWLIPMKINFAIVDVNNSPVEATLDYVATQPGNSLGGKIKAENGNTILTLPDDVWSVSLSIIPIEHHNDLVRMRKLESSSQWQVDNPACHITGSGSEVSVTAIVGRLRPAPIVHVPDDQIPRMVGNPDGVLVYKDNEGLIYHSLFANEYQPFYRLDHPILKNKPPEIAGEWDRLRVVPIDKVDPKKSGVFFHLEYGERQNGPRLFFSLYLPSPGKRKDSKLDYVVFFSPSTALQGRFPVDQYPFRGAYPYGMTDKTKQEYPRHSQHYLFNGVHLVYQLLAAGSDAVIIMPIAPYGDWSVFQSRAGLHRLLLECSLFLHREFLTTPFASVRPGWPEYARAGGSVRLPTGMGFGVDSSLFGRFEPIPPIARAAIAAFSSGSTALQKLLVDTEGKLPEGFTEKRFGANTTTFGNIFKEVWDIDCAHSPYHGYDAFEAALSKWYDKGDKRFRLYHTRYTGGDHDSMTSSMLSRIRKPNDIVNEPTVAGKGTSYWAKERHAANNQWSCVRFDDGFLSSSNTTNARPYWMKDDAHHFIPKIAFGHAAYLFKQT